nr:sigma-E processing peptidase SpoIIGA [uncultured Sellimonas sp.]
MYYEIYIDVFFLVNFMMDYLLLAASARMLCAGFKRRRVLMGAFAGALLTCLVILIPAGGILKLLICHVAVTTVMLLTGIPVNSAREFVKAFLMLYAGAFLLGGIFSFFGQYIRTGSLFFLFAVISYEVMQGIWEFWRLIQRQNRYLCEAVLEQAGEQVRLCALIDTGNRLTDPLTGQPVCIVERQAAAPLLADTQKIRSIAFRSMGNEHAMLDLVQVDSLCLYGKKKKRVCGAWIGLADTTISGDGSYRMLVNPDIFLGGD